MQDRAVAADDPHVVGGASHRAQDAIVLSRAMKLVSVPVPDAAAVGLAEEPEVVVAGSAHPVQVGAEPKGWRRASTPDPSSTRVTRSSG